jgi:uncharacterized 2Fe-2S/4Fe-4S cluster protein (DUF4445 family)
VRPAFGEFAKHAIVSSPRHLEGPSRDEHAYRGRRLLDAGSRLACSARILGDVVVDVPAASQVHRPVVRKTVALDDLWSKCPHHISVPTAATYDACSTRSATNGG